MYLGRGCSEGPLRASVQGMVGHLGVVVEVLWRSGDEGEDPPEIFDGGGWVGGIKVVMVKSARLCPVVLGRGREHLWTRIKRSRT